MNPFQLFRVGELLRAQRVAHEDVRVGEFLREGVVIGKMHDAHGRPAAADGFGQRSGRAPFAEWVPNANGELGLLGRGAVHQVLLRTWRSRPVMSCGAGSPRM